MKIVLVGINAKFIQTNLAIRLLKSYSEKYLNQEEQKAIDIICSEWNINQNVGTILRGIFLEKPDAVFFSVYIWNRILTVQIIEELREVLPNCIIGCGGPEVSWSAEEFLKEQPVVDLILVGEGEETFLELAQSLLKKESLEKVLGLYIRQKDASILFTGTRPLIKSLDTIPFPYSSGFENVNPQHSIIYYESSRGCPFACAYCLSSIERRVRYYSLERVFNDLQFFLEQKVPLVKFVDRTFNLDPDRYVSIWNYIKENYNDITTFHFEITAALLTEEALEFLKSMPEGSIQFEIGIQSTNEATLKKIRRFTDINILEQKIRKIPKTIHTHVDLIAGLPEENLETFARSFDFAFSFHAGMVQLGFLKVLAGTEMQQIALKDPKYKWSKNPPYEILSSPVLSFEDILVLKEVDHLVDTYHNSGLMPHTLRFLSENNESAFRVFLDFAQHVKTYFEDGDLFLPRKAFDMFSCLALYIKKDPKEYIVDPLEWLRFDFLSQGKPGVFPEWYDRSLYSKEEHDKILIKNDLLKEKVSRRLIYSKTEFDFFKLYSKEKIEPVLFMYNGGKGTKKKVEVFFQSYENFESGSDI